jgi:hypothetical protein
LAFKNTIAQPDPEKPSYHRALGPEQEKNIARFLLQGFEIPLTLGDDQIRIPS